MHGVHDEIGGAVHNTAQFRDGIQALAALQIGQPRDTAAYGGRAAQGNPMHRCQTHQLRIEGADNGLVGGDHMLARLQSGADVLIGRVQTAHDLYDDADGAVAGDGGDVRHRQSAQLRPLAPHQNLGDGEIRPLRTEIQNAAAHYAAAQQSDVHKKPPEGQILLPQFYRMRRRMSTYAAKTRPPTCRKKALRSGRRACLVVLRWLNQ